MHAAHGTIVATADAWGDEHALPAQRRPELRKHKTMKTIEDLVDDHKAMENRVPNCPQLVHITVRKTPRRIGTTPASDNNSDIAATSTSSSSSASSSSSYAMLRDYEMATSVLEARQRVELARQRSHVSFGQRKINLDKTFRTAPEGRQRIQLDSPPSSPEASRLQRSLRAASSSAVANSRSAIAQSFATGSTDSSSSGVDDDSSGNPRTKKSAKKSVSFQDDSTSGSSSSRSGSGSDSGGRRRRLSLHPGSQARCNGNNNSESAHVVSPIHAACAKGDYLVVKHVLSFYYGPESTKLVNSNCACGMTALQVASDLGHAKIVKLLLRRDAKPNKHAVSSVPRAPGSQPSSRKRHRSCIALACARQSLDVVQLLIEYGAHVDEDALVTASSLGNVPIVRALINAHKRRFSAIGFERLLGAMGASPSSRQDHLPALEELTEVEQEDDERSSVGSQSRSSLSAGKAGAVDVEWICRAASIAVVYDQPAVLTVLIGDGRSSLSKERLITCATAAVTNGDYKLLRCLTKMFDHSVMINAKGSNGLTLLHIAVKQSSAKCVMLLIRMGVDVDARDPIGITALYMACARGQSAIVRLLVNAGATCERMGPSDETPLHIAAQENHLSCVEILLSEGNAPVDAVTRERSTALHLACQRGNTSVAKCLLDHGADINARTLADETPLLKASRMSNLETVKLLMSRNAEFLSSSSSSVGSTSSALSKLPGEDPSNTASTVSTTFTNHHGHLLPPRDEVESEDSTIRRATTNSHSTSRTPGMSNQRVRGAGSSRPRGNDSIFIAKSNTHTSFKGWLKSVLHKDSGNQSSH
ncbi:hypothetical protein PINS_up005608 [Pythium insidiosum]|nr:hypothetical protein PINS_up005608 [Pythium insidiosum]